MTDKWPYITSACLLVIIDKYEHQYDYLSYILKYLHTKLKDCSIKLNKTFYITIEDQEDIIKQFDSLIKTNPNEFLFVTTTSELIDHFLFKLCNQFNLSKTNLNSSSNQLLSIFESRLILLTKKQFHSSLAHFFQLLLNSKINQTKFYFDSNNTTITNLIIKNLGNNHMNASNSKYGCILSNNNLIINKLFSNYYNDNYIIEVILFRGKIRQKNNNDWEILNNLESQLNFKEMICDNLLNADSYLYDFDRHFNFDLNNNDDHLLLNKRPDLQFLLAEKINLNDFRSKLRQTINIIEETLSKYSQDQTCISFNGGKDCCVVLYLYYAVAMRSKYEHPINVLYIKIENQFDEMNFFIDHVIKNYFNGALNFITFEDTSKSLKECLRELKVTHPKIETVLMGTRRTDSDYFKQMPVFAPTDGDWPKYMRVSPIMDWSFSEIWFFIRLLRLPYCSLYDQGYTSIDNSLNTIPNEALFNQQTSKYMPAYMLESQDLERHSRVAKKK